jgi:hypothetical protein
VLGVIGDRRVADAIVRIGEIVVLGNAGQVPRGPARAVIGRRRPGDVGRTTIEEPAGLLHRDDGCAKRERIRFNLRLVLAGCVGLSIDANLRERHVGKGGQDRREGEHKRRCEDQGQARSPAVPGAMLHVTPHFDMCLGWHEAGTADVQATNRV